VEPRYFDEVWRSQRTAERHHQYDYDTMATFVAASDCVVLFYENVFQSGGRDTGGVGGPTVHPLGRRGFAPYRGRGGHGGSSATRCARSRNRRNPRARPRRRILRAARPTHAERYIAGVGGSPEDS